MSSSKPTGTQHMQLAVQEPWAEQQPYLETGFERAQSDILDKPIQYYPNSMVVPFSGQTEAGLQASEDRALTGSPVLQNAQQNMANTSAGNYLGANPYLQGAIDAASEGITRNYQKAVSPGVDSFAAMHGRYGSGMQKGMHDDAQSNLANQLGNVASTMSYANLDAERNRQMQAAQMAPELAGADYMDIQALLDVGHARERQAGAELEDDASRYYHEQTAPQDALAKYMTLVGGGDFGGTTTTTQPIYSNQGMNLLGGGATLAGILGSLFGQGGVFRGW